MRTAEAVEGELELGRVRFREGDGEVVERGVRRAEDGEHGLEEDAALQRRGRRRRSRGVEVVVVEEVAREGDRAVRRPRAVERVQIQLVERQRKRTRENQVGGKHHAAVGWRRTLAGCAWRTSSEATRARKLTHRPNVRSELPLIDSSMAPISGAATCSPSAAAAACSAFGGVRFGETEEGNGTAKGGVGRFRVLGWANY